MSEPRRPKRFALLSHVLPPSWSGQAVLVSRLLAGFDPGSYCVLNCPAELPDSYRRDYAHGVGGRYYALPPDFRIPRGTRFGLGRMRSLVNVPLRIQSRARHIQRVLQRERSEALVAFTGNMIDLPAACLASRRARIEFYAYVTDYYSYQELRDFGQRTLAPLAEPFVLRGANRVLVLNEFMRDELAGRYGIDPVVIHNPCDLGLYERRAREDHAGGSELAIVYTGAIYEAQLAAFRNMSRAVGLLDSRRARVHVYTAQTPSELAALGIGKGLVHHDHLPVYAVPRVQQAADVLFLPLAFSSAYHPRLINTSAPFKLGEYLAAGRPVLVHSPPGSFVSWYFRRHDCGLVVDEDNPEALKDAIVALAESPELRRRLAENARRRAEADFSVERAQTTFADALGLQPPGRADFSTSRGGGR